MVQTQLSMHRMQVEGLAKAISDIYCRVISAGGLNSLTYNFAVDHIALASQLGGYLAVLRFEEGMHPDLTKELFSEEVVRTGIAPELQRALNTIQRDAASILEHIPEDKTETRNMLSQYHVFLEDLTAALGLEEKVKEQ